MLKGDGKSKSKEQEQENMKAKIEVAEVVVLRARMGMEVTAPGRVMYAPGGDHRICCGAGDNASAVVTIRVGPETAEVLNASLAVLNATYAPQRALFDRNHDKKDAMMWPERFMWSEGPRPGVYVEGDWSALGKGLVEGKVLRAFSGSFLSDAALPKRSQIRAGQRYEVGVGKRGSEENPARMVGLDFPFAGTFTNNPAFHEILPLWAERRAGGGGGAGDDGKIRAEGYVFSATDGVWIWDGE